MWLVIGKPLCLESVEIFCGNIVTELRKVLLKILSEVTVFHIVNPLIPSWLRFGVSIEAVLTQFRLKSTCIKIYMRDTVSHFSHKVMLSHCRAFLTSCVRLNRRGSTSGLNTVRTKSCCKFLGVTQKCECLLVLIDNEKKEKAARSVQHCNVQERSGRSKKAGNAS